MRQSQFQPKVPWFLAFFLFLFFFLLNKYFPFHTLGSWYCFRTIYSIVSPMNFPNCFHSVRFLDGCVTVTVTVSSAAHDQFPFYMCIFSRCLMWMNFWLKHRHRVGKRWTSVKSIFIRYEWADLHETEKRIEHNKWKKKKKTRAIVCTVSKSIALFKSLRHQITIWFNDINWDGCFVVTVVVLNRT